MEWNKLWGNTGVIRTEGALLPVYHLSEREVVLIDTGTKEEPELLAALDARGVRVRAILCTHLHPDHIANNAALIARDGAEVFAARAEVEDLEETFSLMRASSRQLGVFCPEPNHPVTVLDGDRVTVGGAEFAALPTPGHTRGHLAFVTPDGVCCLGDALLSPDWLRASRLPYFEDVDEAVETMERLRQTAYPWYVTAHRGIAARGELSALVEENVRKELELYDVLRRTITGPMEREAAVTKFMEHLGLRPRMVESVLMRHTAHVRLRALIHAGEYREEDGLVRPN